MKNDSLDQKTPFLAFYDLLRIRGIYSTEEKREKLRRGFRRAMALAATLVAFALPQGARAASNLPVPDGWDATWGAEDTEINLTHDTRNWTDFSIGSGFTVNFTGSGTAVNKVTGEATSEIYGKLTGDKVYILNPNGILFGSGAEVDVNGLVAAAMGSFSFGSDLNASDVKGTVTANGVKGDSFTVLIGTSVSGAAEGSTVVATGGTGGMSEGATFNLASADNGATITFAGKTGTGSRLEAPNVVFKENVEIAGGDVNASTGITGVDFTQSAGSITTAGTVDAKVTQTGENATLVAKTVKEIDQTAGTITVESVTGAVKASGTLNGVTGAGLIVGSMELGSTANVDAKGVLVIQGDGTLDGTVVADSVTADSLGVVGGKVTAGEITAAVSQTGGEITAIKVTGTVSVSGDNSSLVTGTIDGNLVQENGHVIGMGAIADGNPVTPAIEITGSATQSGGILGGLDNGAATDNVTIDGALTQTSGSINAQTLTLGADGNAVAGTVNADAIAGGKAIEVQDGGDVNVTAIEADLTVKAGGAVDTKDGTGTLAIDGDLVQDGGQIATTAGENVTISGTTTQNGGTLGNESGTVGLTGALTQTDGDIFATTLTLGADGNTMAGLVSADAIAGGKTVEVQSGADVNVTAIEANLTVKAGGAVDTKDGTGTLAITGALVQDGGDIATVPGENVTVSGTTEQNGGTLGNTTGTVELTGALTQAAGATINATTLTLSADGETAGAISAADIDATGQTLTVKAGADVNVVDTISGNVAQEDGWLAAGTVDGTFDKTGGDAAIGKIDSDVTLNDSTDGTLSVGEITGNLVLQNGILVGLQNEEGTAGSLVVDGTTDQTGGVLGADIDDITLKGALSQTDGEINAATLTLKAGGTVDGDVNATDIDATDQTLTVTENASVNVDDTITGTVAQEGGWLAAGTVDGTLTKTGGDAEIGTIDSDVTLNDDTVGTLSVGEITGNLVLQNGTLHGLDGSLEVGGTTEQSGGVLGGAYLNDDEEEIIDDITLTGALTQTGGEITAATLTLGADGNTMAGTVNADAIAGGKTIEVQSGGDVNATAIAAELTVKDGATVDTKDGIGTLAITGDLVQDGGDIATVDGENVTVSGTTEQNGGTLGNENGTVGLGDALTQAAGATINAKTLTLDGEGNSVAGTVTAEKIDGGKDVEVAGDVNATEIEAALTVKDGATVDTKDGTGTLAITGDLVQDGGDIATVDGENVTVSGTTEQNGGTLGNENGTVGLGDALTQAAGATINAKTLTLDGEGNSVAGTVTAEKIDGGKDVEVAGDVNATEIEAALTVKDGATVDTKDGTGTLAITGDLVQDGGDIATVDGENVTVSGTTTQNGGTLGNTTGTAELTGKLTQTAGEIDASTLTLQGGADQSGGSIAAKDLVLASGANDVALQKGRNDFDTVSGAAGNVAIADVDDLAVSGIETSGDARLVAGTGALTVNGEVKASGDILLQSEGGEVKATADVSGKNVTVAAKSNVEITAAANATEDLYVKADGNIKLPNAPKADATMALVAGGRIDATAPEAATLYTKDRQGEAVTDAESSRQVIDSTGPVERTVKGNTTIGVKTTDKVEITVNNGTLTVGSAASGGKDLKVTEVLAEGGTKETTVAAASGATSVSGISAGKDATITADAVSGGPISAGGTATVTARSGDITSSSISGGNTKVEAQQGSVNSSGEISGKSSVAVTAAKDVKAASITGGKVEVEAKSGEINVSGSVNGGPIDLKAESGAVSAGSINGKGGDVTVKSGGNTTINGSLEGGKVVLSVGGDLEVGGTTRADTLDAGDEGSIGGSATFSDDVEVKDEMLLAVKDDLLFEGTVTAGSIDASEEGVGSATFQGDVTADTVAIKASDSIKTESATITTSDSISLEAGKDVDVSLKSKKIDQIKGGGNVTIVETATDTVSLGLLQAGGNLSLTSKKAGFSDGNGGQPNLVVERGSVILDVGGQFGSAGDPMEARLSRNGTFTIKNGDLKSVDDPGFIHVIIETDDPSAVPEVVYDDPIGLVLVNRQIRGGDPRLIRRMNRALAFTVNTPELKSSQGVFGDAAFIHTGMDISEARSIGSVGALSLDVQDYHGIFDDLTAPGTGFGKMSPPILPGKSPLKDKIDQAETPASQPDVKNFQD